MIEMRVVDLRQDEQNVVWLQSVEGSVMVPIEIGHVEYRSIRSELAGKSMPRPLAYDLMYAMLAHFDAEVEKVQIVELQNQIFYAELILFARGEQVHLDARPSDSIVTGTQIWRTHLYGCQNHSTSGIQSPAHRIRL